LADRLPEGHQIHVHVPPEPPRQDAIERGARLFRRARGNQPQAVADAVHVGVDRDRAPAEGVDDDDTCHLDTDPREPRELLDGVGHPTAVVVQHGAGEAPHGARLGTEEAGRSEEALQALAAHPQEVTRRPHDAEQTLEHAGERLVARACGEDRAHGDAEGIAAAERGKATDGSVPGGHLAADPAEAGLERPRVHPLLLRPPGADVNESAAVDVAASHPCNNTCGAGKAPRSRRAALHPRDIMWSVY
jgi:hypothetical protein